MARDRKPAIFVNGRPAPGFLPIREEDLPRQPKQSMTKRTSTLESPVKP